MKMDIKDISKNYFNPKFLSKYFYYISYSNKNKELYLQGSYKKDIYEYLIGISNEVYAHKDDRAEFFNFIFESNRNKLQITLSKNLKRG
jgi:hypothetical protein